MSDNGDETCMWKPSDEDLPKLELTKFREHINRKFNLSLKDYWQLYDWSVSDHFEQFWEECFHYCSVKYTTTYSEVLTKCEELPFAPRWFKDCTLNYAENLLHYANSESTRHLPAIIEVHEQQLDNSQTWTYGQLADLVNRYRLGLRRVGVGSGDRVAGYIPNSHQAVCACLAAASLGAVWSSASPDFGEIGVLDRFQQIQPTVLFSVNAVVYKQQVHDHMKKLAKVVEGLPDLRTVVVIPYVADGVNKDQLSHIRNAITLDEFLDVGEIVEPLQFVPVPFHHPLFVMFSSGTTGAPKCMVHSVGGSTDDARFFRADKTHKKEHLLHGNLGPGERMLYYTTTGWMMWNWLLSVLSVGCAVVLYDGSPLVPSPNVLWDIIDKLDVTVLGTGAKWISVLEDLKVHPKETNRLDSLKQILSTGSPLKPTSYDYVYNCIKQNVLLGSITGGTDLISCFALQNPTLPVHRGQLQSPGLGMAIQCWPHIDSVANGGFENSTVAGKHLWDTEGELVCVRHFPSQPVFFWNDPDGSKYRRAYFAQAPAGPHDPVWTHGDFCQFRSATRGIIMHGRCDSTLNPNGVRFGSSDIYNVVEGFKEVDDSLCVAQRNADGSEERVILFIKVSGGSAEQRLTNELVSRIQSSIRSQLSARHTPSKVLEISEIPYTVSGKKVEVAVSRILSALSSQDQEAIEKLRSNLKANAGALLVPTSLDQFWALGHKLAGF